MSKVRKYPLSVLSEDAPVIIPDCNVEHVAQCNKCHHDITKWRKTTQTNLDRGPFLIYDAVCGNCGNWCETAP